MSEPFQLHELPALSRATVDRQEGLRSDSDRLLSNWGDARVIVIDDDGRSPVREGEASLATRKAMVFGSEPPDTALFLGRTAEHDYWAILGVNPEYAPQRVPVAGNWGFHTDAPTADGELWLGLRGQGDLLDDTSAGLFTTAIALRNWHRRAGFCARCGGKQHQTDFGWSRRCESCGRQEFPRTDPAVICLVHDDVGNNGEHVLLARQPTWPKDRFSVVAGFVEAGEALESCVTREVREEVGIDVGDVRYLGSQPWPFPRSIMLGFSARAHPGAMPRPADGEIAEAYWFSREAVRQAIAVSDGHADTAASTSGDGGDGPQGTEMLLPGNSSIARVMLEAWVSAEP